MYLDAVLRFRAAATLFLVRELRLPKDLLPLSLLTVPLARTDFFLVWDFEMSMVCFRSLSQN